MRGCRLRLHRSACHFFLLPPSPHPPSPPSPPPPLLGEDVRAERDEVAGGCSSFCRSPGSRHPHPQSCFILAVSVGRTQHHPPSTSQFCFFSAANVLGETVGLIQHRRKRSRSSPIDLLKSLLIIASVRFQVAQQLQVRRLSDKREHKQDNLQLLKGKKKKGPAQVPLPPFCSSIPLHFLCTCINKRIDLLKAGFKRELFFFNCCQRYHTGPELLLKLSFMSK